jgi:zinc transporter 9
MADSGSARAVIAAVVGNGSIAVLKIGAFVVSGSGAMLAEGIHSIADTMNQALLWLGIARSRRRADPKHPYGYGAERYFWALVSAMGIFVLGCGVTVYHGIHQLMHPTMPEVGWLTWAVLAVSALVEGGVLALALKDANTRREGKSWRHFLASSSDPTLLAVIFEDTVAVGGVFVAAAGIGLSLQTGWSGFDGVASIIIGLLLGALALALALKNKELLIGRSAAPEIEEKIRKIVHQDKAVSKVLALKTRVLAAGEVRDFESDSIIDRLTPEIQKRYGTIDSEEELMAFSRELGRRLIDELAIEVDRLEAAIREEVPSASLIDIEGD